MTSKCVPSEILETSCSAVVAFENNRLRRTRGHHYTVTMIRRSTMLLLLLLLLQLPLPMLLLLMPPPDESKEIPKVSRTGGRTKILQILVLLCYQVSMQL